jgi:hypothetical protein
MSRWKAAAIHLSISIFIGLVTAALLFGLWYPPPYFHAAGADELVLLLVGVDLTLGPLLTFIVFRSGKWGLKFDLVLIGLVQSAALIYGLSVVLQSRPVFLVGAVDRFVLVSANEITDGDLAQGAEPEFRSRSWTGPRLVVAQMPTSLSERDALVSSALAGQDIQNLPKYFRDYAKSGRELLAKAKPVDSLRKQKPQFGQMVDHWLEDSKRSEASVVWLPLVTRKEDLVMMLDAETAQPLRVMAINPW